MAWLDNLVSYWKLDEASGNAIDSHGSNTLTDVNTVGSATGKIGNARDFEAGNSEYFIRNPAGDSLSTGDIDFTFSLWLQAESVPAATIIAKWGTLEEFTFYNDGTILTLAVASPGGTVSVFASNFGAVPIGAWCHVVFWHDSTANQIWIAVNNGTPNTASVTGGLNAQPTAPLLVGGYNNVGQWDGLIDEIGFWKRVLTPAERTALYNGGAGLAYPFGAITGTGALASQSAAVVGSGAVLGVVSGTGALVAQSASVSGAGVSRSTGSGALVAGAAAIAGAGVARSTGSGALIAQAASVNGAGVSRSTGVGVLVAQAATLAGTGAAQGAGQGVLVGQSALISGTGTIGLATVTGSGALVAGAALVTGTGVTLAVSSGTGVLVAGQATLSATGTSETAGTGALQARAAIVAGQFIVTTGVGVLNAGRATIAGTGTTTGASVSVDFEGDLIDVIGPLVGGRAYPNTFPQDGIWPAIRYTLVSVEPNDDLCSHAEEEDGVETSDVRVQFDLVAETYTQARDLRMAMRKAMRNFDPPALRSAEFNTYDTETKVHRVVVDYVFHPSSD